MHTHRLQDCIDITDCRYQISTVIGPFVDSNINVWIKTEDGPKFGWASPCLVKFKIAYKFNFIPP